MALNLENHKSYSKLAQIYKCYKRDYPAIDLVKRVLLKQGDINYKFPSTSQIRLTEPNLIGGTALHLAVLENKVDVFDTLIFNGADITVQNKEGRTPLHCIIYKKDIDCTKPFTDIAFSTHLSLGDPSNPCDVNGISHLHIACMKNHANVVEFFLNCGSPIDAAVNLDSKKFAGYTPLHFAAEGCALSVIDLLLKHGASTNIKDARGLKPLHVLLNEKINLMDTFSGYGKNEANTMIEGIDKSLEKLLDNEYDNHLGLTSFHVACAMRETSVAEFQLKEPLLDINQQVKMDSAFCPGYTALHFAVHCNLKMAKALLAKQAKFEVSDANGTTAMDILWQKQPEELQAILDQQIFKYVLLNNGNFRLLELAKNMNDCSLLRYHLSQYDSFSTKVSDASHSWSGRTILHYAVLMCNRVESLRIFVESGLARAVINTKDSNGSTPLHLAFRKNKLDFVRILMGLTYLGSENLVDEDGLSYLHIACALKNPGYVQRFGHNKLNVVCRRNYAHPWIKSGFTAMHVAMASGETDIINMLLDRDVYLQVQDVNSKTPLHQFLQLKQNSICICASLLINNKVTDQMLKDIGLNRLHLAIYCKIDYYRVRIYSESELLRMELNCDDPSSFLHCYDGCTPLHMAIKRKLHLDFLNVLLELDTDLLRKNRHGECPLYAALDENSNYQILCWIFDMLQLNKELRKQLEEISGITMLHLACYLTELDCVKRLLTENVGVEARVRFDCPVWSGCTPLHVLMKGIKNLTSNVTVEANEILELLLEKNADVSVMNGDGETPIHLAVKAIWKESVHKVVNLLLTNLEVFYINPLGANGLSHFHVACLVNNSHAVKQFLDKVDVNQPVDFFAEEFAGQTPLHLAVERKPDNYFNSEKEEEVVKLLIMYGADVTAEDSNGSTPLHKAVSTRRNIRIWQKIVDNARDVIESRNISDRTPLELLLKSTKFSVNEFQFFIDNKCLVNNSNSLTEEGYISILISEKYHPKIALADAVQTACYETMLDSFDAHSLDDMGRSLIHNIVTTNVPNDTLCNFDALIKQFQFVGIDIDLQDKKGKTPLHLAAQFGNIQAVTALLNAGADINIADLADKSPLEYAIEYQYNQKYCPEKKCHLNVIKYLTSHSRTRQKLGLGLSEKNLKAKVNALNVMKPYDRFDCETKSDRVASTIQKLSNNFIGNTEIRVGDFMSVMGKGWISYPFMTDGMREKVDYFFSNYEEQSSKGVCMLQYRKGLKRMPLVEKALDCMKVVTNISLPIVCIEMIFQYLENYDLENFVKGIAVNG